VTAPGPSANSSWCGRVSERAARPRCPAPSEDGDLSEQAEDRAPVVEDEAGPFGPSHLGEVDPSKGQAGEQMEDAIGERLVAEPPDGAGDLGRSI
jgi:hypothetical protein